jgi:hypothetical protein
MEDGVDWYCTKSRRYLSSTRYGKRTDYRYVVGINFIDERTVVVGHSEGQLIFATLGMAEDPAIYLLNKRGASGL